MQQIAANTKNMKIAIDKAVIQKVDHKTTSKGKAYVRINFCEISKKRQTGEDYVNGFAWANIWEPQNAQGLQPGHAIQVLDATGKINKYKDRNGVDHKDIDISINNFQVLGVEQQYLYNKGNNGYQQPQQPQGQMPGFGAPAGYGQQPQQPQYQQPAPQTQPQQPQYQPNNTGTAPNQQFGGYVNNLPQAQSAGNYGG